MGKSNRKGKPKGKLKEIPKQHNNAHPPEGISKKGFKISWGSSLGIIASIVTIVLFFPTICNWFKTPKEKYEDEVFVTGKLKAPVISPSYSLVELPVIFSTNTLENSKDTPFIHGILVKDLDKRNTLSFIVGGKTLKCNVDDLHHGIRLLCPGQQDFFCHLTIVSKNNRIYVSTAFNDLRKEENIGTIEFNRWRLYKPNLLLWKDDDYKLEVRDKQNLIVFSMSYMQGSDFVSINGYFIDPYSIWVLSDNNDGDEFKPFSKEEANWKQRAEEYIRKIRSRF
jgi:hypothetical protein